jgi:hypothetical protein
MLKHTNEDRASTFRQLLDDYHVHYEASGPKTRQGWLNLRCVRCQKDPYLGFNIARSYCSCWSCGYLPLWEVIHKLTHLPEDDCRALAGDYKSGASARLDFKPTGHSCSWPTGYHAGLLPPHEAYLLGRGFIPAEVAERWSIGGIDHLGGRLAWRIFIPIFMDGLWASWTTRTIGTREPRYIGARDDECLVSLQDCLYGLDHCRQSVILVEGPLDAWAGGPGFVANLGVNTSCAKLERLSRYPLRVTCFDNESQAQARARKLADDLSVFGGVTRNVVLESGKDPSRADPAELEQLRREFVQ